LIFYLPQADKLIWQKLKAEILPLKKDLVWLEFIRRRRGRMKISMVAQDFSDLTVCHNISLRLGKC